MMSYLKKDKTFSLRKFSRAVGIKSSSFLSRVLRGERNITRKNAALIALGFGCRKMEVHFFENLVLFNQAADLQDKDNYFKVLMKFRGFRQAKMMALAQYEQFSHWYMVAILEGIGTEWGTWSLSRMAESLKISEDEVTHAFETLQRLGLIKKEGKYWRRMEAAHETPLQMRSLQVRNFHKEMVTKALSAVDEGGPDDRVLAAITLPLSKENWQAVKKRILDFGRELASLYAEDPKAQSVAQINFQMFSLIQLLPSESESKNKD